MSCGRRSSRPPVGSSGWRTSSGCSANRRAPCSAPCSTVASRRSSRPPRSKRSRCTSRRTTSSPHRSSTTRAACSARSRSTTCSTTCCRRTGAIARTRLPGGSVSRRETRRPRSEQTREARAERRTDRLDVPRQTRRLIPRPQFEDDTFGRFAERFARFMGTARFLLYMTAFVGVWLLWNWLGPSSGTFDGYPFIFLTLMLSLQASYAAPLILLAQNRQEDRDRGIAEQDRTANTRAHADMEFLAREMASLRIALGEVATRDYVRSELRSLVADLDERDAEEPDDQGDQVHGPQGTDPVE